MGRSRDEYRSAQRGGCAVSKLVADQADGLRRLLAQTRTRVLAFASMGRGLGVTTMAMNLGAALAYQGREVLLLDEHGTDAGTASAAWAVEPLGTLADVANRRLTLQGAAARAPCGVQVLPAVPRTPAGSPDPRTLWEGDVILIDAVLDGEGQLSALAQAADELVLVMQPHAASITATYAGIKRLHYAHALRQLRFLVNGVAEPGGGAAGRAQPGAGRQPLPRGLAAARRLGAGRAPHGRRRAPAPHRGGGLSGQPRGGGLPPHRRRDGPVALAPGREPGAASRARDAGHEHRRSLLKVLGEGRRTTVYTAQGTIEKSHLLKQHQPMVRRMALQMLAKLPASVELDDLIQAGMIGLLDASTRYQDNRGAQFETFASQRIRGAMLDELRANDWGSRGLRQSARKVEGAIQTLEHRLGRAPTEGEIAKELKMTLEAYQGLLQEIQGCQLLYVEDFSADGEGDSPFLDRHASEARGERGGDDDPLAQLLESGFRHQLVDAIGRAAGARPAAAQPLLRGGTQPARDRRHPGGQPVARVPAAQPGHQPAAGEAEGSALRGVGAPGLSTRPPHVGKRRQQRPQSLISAARSPSMAGHGHTHLQRAARRSPDARR